MSLLGTPRKKEEAEEEEEEEDDGDDIVFQGAACGFAHTMLITENGLLLACGNHRYGQLGIAEKHEKLNLVMCERCLLLQAVYECFQCVQADDRGKPSSYLLCETCDAAEHKIKAKKLHKRQEIPKPLNRKMRTAPMPVKTQERLRRMDEDGDEHASWRVVELNGVRAVSCGVSHTLAIADCSFNDLHGVYEGDVYAWGCGSSGRTGLLRVNEQAGVRGAATDDVFEAQLIEHELVEATPPALRSLLLPLPMSLLYTLEATPPAAPARRAPRALRAPARASRGALRR